MADMQDWNFSSDFFNSLLSKIYRKLLSTGCWGFMQSLVSESGENLRLGFEFRLLGIEVLNLSNFQMDSGNSQDEKLVKADRKGLTKVQAEGN